MKNEIIFSSFTKKKDKTMNVKKNRVSFLEKNNLSDKLDITMNLIHGNKVCIVDDSYRVTECDGLITQRKDVVLFVHVADCLPILFFDPMKEVIAAAHGGREGTFKNIVAEMIHIFKKEFHSKVENILVDIGPGVGLCCYEVSKVSNVYENFVKDNFGTEYTNKGNIDIAGITKLQLVKLGVKDQNINTSKICTICGGYDYFSFRKDSTKERFAGVIGFK